MDPPDGKRSGTDGSICKICWKGPNSHFNSHLTSIVAGKSQGVGWGPLRAIHFTLGSPFCGGERSQRVEHHDKVEKLLLRLKRGRRGQVALLGLVFVLDLVDLTAVGASTAVGREPPRPHSPPDAPQTSHL